ncbi:MAG: hypothetical protein CM15mP96_3480 [Gammaproteobacteria bacterium]|nr:MAG: hypothetical protein CM15mP96_3480 [Gammaproteobacteria bacterium]
MQICSKFLSKNKASVEREVVLMLVEVSFHLMKVMIIMKELLVYADAIKSGIEENWDTEYKIMIEPGRAIINNSD